MGSSEEKSGGCGGCLLAIVGLLAIIFGFYYLGDIHGQQMLHAGDESRFDAVKAFKYAEELAEAKEDGLSFMQLTARFVRSDGTMDLDADYAPTVLYQWVGGANPDAPVGAGGERKQFRTVRATAFGFEHSATLPGGEKFYNLNMGLRRTDSWLKTRGEAAAPPTCSFADLWKAAIAKGAQTDAVAIIHYNATGYDFQIEGTSFEMRFGADCKPTK